MLERPILMSQKCQIRVEAGIERCERRVISGEVAYPYHVGSQRCAGMTSATRCISEFITLPLTAMSAERM
jgi:hypothetical protein